MTGRPTLCEQNKNDISIRKIDGRTDQKVHLTKKKKAFTIKVVQKA